MKTTAIALGALGVFQLVTAQPHRVRHAHKKVHVKKDAVVAFTDVTYVEARDSPNVVVVVDQFGDVLSATTEYPTPAPVPATAVAPVFKSSAASVELPVSSSSAPVETSSTSSSTGNGFGFSYSPYLANKGCKSQDQVNQDFKKIGDGYSLVRIYGTDCNQTATVLTAAKNNRLKLFAGIFDLSDLEKEVGLIADAANGDWSHFDYIGVGNELVNSGKASPSAVVDAIGQARTLLKARGYTGKVGTVDTLVAARANPSLCDASDRCTVNCHPFFDGGVAAKGAGEFLTTMIPTLRNVLANKGQEIMISETGWPWKGDNNKIAVPSTTNQADAISSIKSAFATSPQSVILFTVFNDMWKTNSPDQFEAEQFWGFNGDAPSG